MAISSEGRDRHTVNLLKTMYFDGPDYTPCRVGLMPATWMKYGEALDEVVLAHPRLFPGHKKGSATFEEFGDPLYELGEHTDAWGTVWRNIERGLTSFPTGYPLTDWDDFDSYTAPNPDADEFGRPRDWESTARALAGAKEKGHLATGWLVHGFMYLRLTYLRGFENLMLDIASGEPRLAELIRMVEDQNMAVVGKWIEAGAEYMVAGDDLGLQQALPMSPAHWREYVKPSYERIFAPCREADIPVYLHTDGHVLEIIGDLIDVGVTIINPQIRANGLPGLQKYAKGRVVIDLDLDRQLFPFASPRQLREHVREAYEALRAPEGGLMLYAECEPDVPLANIDAICCALEEVCNPPEV